MRCSNRSILRWKSRSKRCVECALPLVCAVAAWFAWAFVTWAVRDVGNFFGWIVGSSLSSIASVVAPLIFGLLSVGILGSLGKVFTTSLYHSQKGISWWNVGVTVVCVLVLAHFTSAFVFHARVGYYDGSTKRAKYKREQELREFQQQKELLRLEQELRATPGITSSVSDAP